LDLSSEVFRSNKSGVKSESLVLFGQPLWVLYDVSERDLVAFLREGEDSKRKECTAALSMSRLLWAYFSLDDDHRIDALTSLIQYCVGESATEKEIGEVTDLLIVMNQKWATFSAEDREESQTVPGYRTLSFFEWIDYAISLTANSEDSIESFDDLYGPENLSMPEAMAVFSSKLLDDIEDPEDLDAATFLASAYWDLCHSLNHPVLFDENLRQIEGELAEKDGDREKIRKQAQEMVDHFISLFPEKSSRATVNI